MISAINGELERGTKALAEISIKAGPFGSAYSTVKYSIEKKNVIGGVKASFRETFNKFGAVDEFERRQQGGYGTPRAALEAGREHLANMAAEVVPARDIPTMLDSKENPWVRAEAAAKTVYKLAGIGLLVRAAWGRPVEAPTGVKVENPTATDAVPTVDPVPTMTQPAASSGMEPAPGQAPVATGLPRYIYRGSTGSKNSLTPRPVQDTQGGLSFSETIEGAVKKGEKFVTVDTTKLQNLCAECDGLTQVTDASGQTTTLPPGHVSVKPAAGQPALDEWAATKGTDEIHPLTQELLNAVEGAPEKRTW